LDALQTANAQSQKLLKAAGKTNKQLQKDLTEKDKQFEKAGDPDALKKAKEELAAAGKTDRQQKAAIEKVQKENALLKEALENYKRQDDQRAYGKGHEKEYQVCPNPQSSHQRPLRAVRILTHNGRKTWKSSIYVTTTLFLKTTAGP